MIDSVNLSATTRQILASQQLTAALSDRATENISTGRRVNRVNDDPVAYIKARDLSNRAGDLLAVKDRIGQGLSAIEGASVGLRSLNGVVEQLRSIAASARGGNAEERQAAAETFDRVSRQLDSIAADSGYSGVNLIGGSPQDLDVVINDKGETLTVSGLAADSAGLGVGSAAGDYGNLATDADIDAALAGLDAAKAAIRSSERSFTTDVSVLGVRESFSENMSNTLRVGSDRLVAADMDEQAANLLSLQVRQKLGNVSLNLISEKNSAIAGLF